MPEWRKQVDLVARPAARVVAELSVYYTLSCNEDEEPVSNAGALRWSVCSPGACGSSNLPKTPSGWASNWLR